MNYKLVSLDLDGTLLGTDTTISSRSARVLERADALGIRIVINTGRIFAEAERLTRGLRSISAIASSNGAYIVDLSTRDVIFERPLGLATIEEVIRELESSGVFYCAYGHGAIFLRRGLLPKSRDVVPEGEGRFCDIAPVDDAGWQTGRLGIPVYKLNVLDRNLDAIARLRDRLGKRTDIELSGSSPYNLEVTARGVNKGAALRFFGNLWGIERRETAAIGDGENDIPMFKGAGLSIAMGDAPETVHDAALRITGTPREEGVATAVEDWVLASLSGPS